jgi:dihydrofolate reductase
LAGAIRIEGYAIVSADGNIAGGNGIMPPTLQFEADQAHLAAALDAVDLLVHGARSHEGQARSAERRRLIMTRRVASLAPDAATPNAMLWNPEGASLEQACAAFGVSSGRIAVLGGPEVYRHFLEAGYDAFHLSRAGGLVIPSGLPLFARRAPAESAEALLARQGLVPDAAQALDGAHDLTLTIWRRRL